MSARFVKASLCIRSHTVALGLRRWFEEELRPWFAGRILPITEAIAERWGIFEGKCQLGGIGFNALDELIAATAAEHDLTVVTRNVRDFAGFRVPVLNPGKMPEVRKIVCTEPQTQEK